MKMVAYKNTPTGALAIFDDVIEEGNVRKVLVADYDGKEYTNRRYHTLYWAHGDGNYIVRKKKRHLVCEFTVK